MPPCVSCLCVGAACGGTQIFTSSSGSFFFSYGGLYLFIRTLAVNRDSVSSTAPLANLQWQNYNSCPSIELCRSGVVQLYSCHWASCGRARFPRVILMFFLFFLKNIHGFWMAPGKSTAWIKYARRVPTISCLLWLPFRANSAKIWKSRSWCLWRCEFISVCFPDSLFSLSKLMCFYIYVCFTLPANRGPSIFLDHPNSKDLCAQDIFTLAYYSVFTAAYGFLIGILP